MAGPSVLAHLPTASAANLQRALSLWNHLGIKARTYGMLSAPSTIAHHADMMSERSRAVQAEAGLRQLIQAMTEMMAMPMEESTAHLLVSGTMGRFQAGPGLRQLTLAMTDIMTMQMHQSAAGLLIMISQCPVASSTLMQAPSRAAQIVLAMGLLVAATESAQPVLPCTLQLRMMNHRILHCHLSQPLLIPARALKMPRG